MDEETKSQAHTMRSRLVSNESLSMSETEYNFLLSGLSPRHKNNEQVLISIEFLAKYKGKHIIYKVFGSDSSGAFESTRRYNDFLALRTIMCSQWPGCYIPKLPPKKRIVFHM